MVRKPLSEKEWLAADRWQDLLIALFPNHRYAKAAGAQRKLRLLLCAAVRLGWDVMPDDRCRRAVEVAERFANGQATVKQLAAARAVAKEACNAAIGERNRQERLSHKEFDQRLRAAGGAEEWSNRWPSDLAVPYAEQLRAEFAARIVVCAAAESISVAVVESGLMFVPDVVISVEELAARMPEWHEVGTSDPPDPRPDLVRDVFGYPFAPVKFVVSWRTDTVTALAEAIVGDGAFDRLPILADALEEAGCDNQRLLDHCRAAGPHVRGCWAVDVVRGDHWQPGARTRGR
ncbi:MAG TPA: hypothetical protein VFG68_15425 [Fimbriiglobus sp.]|nr:hypothetical protein [Fimbriiglobus sp.]